MERYQRAFRAYGKSFILFFIFSILTGVAIHVLLAYFQVSKEGPIFGWHMLCRSLTLPVITMITMIFMQKAWSGNSPEPKDLKLLPRVVIPVIIVNLLYAYYPAVIGKCYSELKPTMFFMLFPLLALGILLLWIFRQIYFSLKAANIENAFTRSFYIVFQHPFQSFAVIFRAFWPYLVAFALSLCLLPLFGPEKLTGITPYTTLILEPITAFLSIDCAMSLLAKLDPIRTHSSE